MRGAILPVAVLAGACGNLGAFQPWHTHAAVADKPPSPIVAPSDHAMLVVLLGIAQGSGNGAYTVFERTDHAVALAQFGETMVGWSLVEQTPGVHHYYLRTWASDFCQRVDADLAPGKAYILSVNPDESTQVVGNDHVIPLAIMVEGPNAPAGALAFHPFVTLDAAAAQRELDEHRGQLADCISHADRAFEKAKMTAHGTGFDSIAFEVPR